MDVGGFRGVTGHILVFRIKDSEEIGLARRQPEATRVVLCNILQPF